MLRTKGIEVIGRAIRNEGIIGERPKTKPIGVNNKMGAMSTNRIALRVVRSSRRVHGIVMRHNIPASVPILDKGTYKPLITHKVPTLKSAPRTKTAPVLVQRSPRLNQLRPHTSPRLRAVGVRNPRFTSNAALLALQTRSTWGTIGLTSTRRTATSMGQCKRGGCPP